MSSKFFPVVEVVVWTRFGRRLQNSRPRKVGVLPKDRPATTAKG
ncbi:MULTISPECIES: hypothetical protein [unclassified Rhizobium]|nr:MULTISPECIES: hypothetical protein [unclassified Rhizobium]